MVKTTIYMKKYDCSMRITEKHLKKIVEESIKKYLSEDISPEIKTSPAKTAWESLSNALFNIQQYMKHRENELIPNPNNPKEGKRHPITTEDVKKWELYTCCPDNFKRKAVGTNLRLFTF